MEGLGRETGTARLHLPKVDDWHVVGEASLSAAHFEEPAVRDRLRSYGRAGAFSLCSFDVRISRFDDLDDPALSPASGERVIVKIDVEGAEEQVLEGMSGYIEAVSPIFLIENSPDSRVPGMLRDRGYAAYHFRADSMRLWPAGSALSLNSVYVRSGTAEAQPDLAAVIAA
jgi:FkbM family methyltransferase